MTCAPTKTPDTIDIPAMRERYRRERDKRLNPKGGSQYTRPSGELADQYAFDPHLPIAPRAPVLEEIDAVILGGGFSGLLAGYHLKKAGISDFRHIDHAGDFGGVWYWNRYPGIQCDNDAYCYLPLLEETGFMPSKKFSDGAEIYGYCRLIAEKFGFRERALFHTLIESLRWDDASKRWTVRTNRGDSIRARFVVMACGVLNMPKLPGIPGIADFKGKMFHTARWDYGYTGGSYENPVLDKLSDKRVAIVGTGATAIQATPFLARHAKQLYVLQRTPSSVDERPNPPTNPEWLKSLKPGWQAARIENFQRGAQEFFGRDEPDLVCDIWTEISRNLANELATAGWPELSFQEFMARREVADYRVMERLRRRVDTLVQDPQTAEALKPYYRFLCKRPLSNNEYYPSFNRKNVRLIDVSDTQGVERLTATGFVANGEEVAVDCVIFASGFEASGDLERRWGISAVEGRGGRSIYSHWAEGPKTLHGVMTHGFPNQFYLGYIQGGLNASTTEQFGRQAQHVAYIVAETLKRGAKAVEPTQQAQDAYVKHFDDTALDLSQFTSECTPSYYNNEGQVKAPWTLLRGYGPGWSAFQQLLTAWRDRGDLEGLELSV